MIREKRCGEMVLDIRHIFLVIHIFLAMVWVGGILFVGWGVFPTVKLFNVLDQQRFLIALMKKTHYIFSLAGMGVITTGVILGTIYGPIHEVNQLWQLRYGQIFSMAFMIGVFTLSWGVFVGYRYTMSVLKDNSIWNYASKGFPSLLNQKLFKVTLVTGVEVTGFVLIIYLMVLL